MKRLALLIALVAATALTGSASAASTNEGWLQTRRNMENNLLAYGLDFRGVNNHVWAATCVGAGYSEWIKGRRWWAYLRCEVGIYGDAFATVRVWPTGPEPWQYRSRFLRWS